MPGPRGLCPRLTTRKFVLFYNQDVGTWDFSSQGRDFSAPGHSQSQWRPRRCSEGETTGTERTGLLRKVGGWGGDSGSRLPLDLPGSKDIPVLGKLWKPQTREDFIAEETLDPKRHQICEDSRSKEIPDPINFQRKEQDSRAEKIPNPRRPQSLGKDLESKKILERRDSSSEEETLE